MQLSNKKVLVVGLGKSGNAAARLCIKLGATVRATDARMDAREVKELAALGVVLSLGGHREEDFQWAEDIVLSPGVDHRLPEIQRAASRGARVLGELALAYEFINCPSIMITGSNGKTTVSTLIAGILRAAGFSVFAGGNLGTPLSQLVLDGDTPDWAVLEISSFQADTADNLKPKVGIVLNLTPDHLDRYNSFAEYADSKFRMLKNQTGDDLAILCSDDKHVVARIDKAPALRMLYGEDYPKLDNSAWLQGNFMVLRLPEREPVMIDIAGSQLTGTFNQLNMLAVAAACLYVGVDVNVIREELLNFTGLPHRMVKVAEINGVTYYNDSKGTNIGAVQAAVNAISTSIVLLLGGRDKQGDFKKLLPILKNKATLVVCFGEAGPLIYEQLRHEFPCQLVDTLADAVKAAHAVAKRQQAVLLSPGCASFDAYGSYSERGEHFAELVKQLMENNN